MKRSTRPLFEIDPGWLFVLAGLAICSAGMLLPAQTDLQVLERQLGRLQAEEAQAYARLKAHADFLDQVDQADPALIKRLAATQLNMVPQGETPVLRAATHPQPVTDWIDATVQVDIRAAAPGPQSTLSKLANGPHRLWLFGGGIMAVFVGVMLGPGTLATRTGKLRENPEAEFALRDAAEVAETDGAEAPIAGAVAAATPMLAAMNAEPKSEAPQIGSALIEACEQDREVVQQQVGCDEASGAFTVSAIDVGMDQGAAVESDADALKGQGYAVKGNGENALAKQLDEHEAEFEPDELLCDEFDDSPEDFEQADFADDESDDGGENDTLFSGSRFDA